MLTESYLVGVPNTWGFLKAWWEQAAADRAGTTSQTSSSRAVIRKRFKELRSNAADTLKFKNGVANGIFGYVFGAFAVTMGAAAVLAAATVVGPAVFVTTAALLVYAGVNAAVFGLVVNHAKEDAAKAASKKAGSPVTNAASDAANVSSMVRPAAPSSQPTLPPARTASHAFARVAGRIERIVKAIPNLIASLSHRGRGPTSTL